MPTQHVAQADARHRRAANFREGRDWRLLLLKRGLEVGVWFCHEKTRLSGDKYIR
jgi:hypothetical protein